MNQYDELQAIHNKLFGAILRFSGPTEEKEQLKEAYSLIGQTICQIETNMWNGE